MDWKKKTTLISVCVGAVFGLIVAKMMINDAEERGDEVVLDAQNGQRIAMALLEAVRKIR